MKTILLFVIGAALLYSCNDITKGYLETDEAEYSTDSLVIYSEYALNDSVPYQSEHIQGIVGTFPIRYSIEAVRDSNGEIMPAEVSGQIRIVLQSVITIEKNHTIPEGRYVIDLRVSNVHGFVVLTNVYTVIVRKKNDD